MAIDNGDFVRVNFTGKVKETDEVFDTTYDEIAQEAGIFDENKTYKAIPIVVGGNHLLPAIEEAIIGLEEGETKHIEVDSDNAFGPRDPKNIQLVPMKEFKKQGSYKIVCTDADNKNGQKADSCCKKHALCAFHFSVNEGEGHNIGTAYNEVHKISEAHLCADALEDKLKHILDKLNYNTVYRAENNGGEQSGNVT